MGSQSHYRGTVDGNTVKQGNLFVDGKEISGCWIVKPKALDIIWGSDSRYWRLPTSENQTAELLQVSWLEVNGSLDLKSLAPKTYKLTFKVSMQPDAFGWKGSPVYLMAKVGPNKNIWKSYDLSKHSQSPAEIPTDLRFTLTDGQINSGDKLRFGIYEIWRGRWKGGLVIHEVQIIPID